ncbi:tail collar domain-containing protein [Rhizobium phage vB_RglS_P106B]|uniref:Tail collar domain-containing protein n=1 Tax=Rhizobium phage vB_RglS_P106B TaxID=1458697 RepID=W6EKG4_9CAUD|nr:tail fiber protein [Rhizobium phage vB_RglS_P106B]AHJ10721.1 tail collar domain-containing protein [Rhizobium phage vB_RglS_P106B]
MTQFDFGTINPTLKNGTDLASDLNQFRDALLTLHSGSARPSYVQPGMQWIDNSTPTKWKLNLYDGTDDILIGTFDTTNNFFKAANTRQEVTKTAAYTLVSDDQFVAILMNSASVVATGLPAVASSNSEFYFVRNIGTAITNIDPNGSEQIEGTTLLPLPPGASAWIWPNAAKTAWRATVVYPETYFAKSSDDVGKVHTCAFTAVPAGTMECNGAAVSRTVYSGLYAKLGTTWGVGDGSTTFNLPDFRGEFLRGWDNSRGVDSGRVFGSAQGQDMQPHNHTVDPPSTTTSDNTHNHTGTAANAGAHNHGMNLFTSGTAQARPMPASGQIGSNTELNTDTDGEHSHALTINNNTHNHTVNIGSFASGTSGTTETRPRNKTVMYVIVY